MTLMQSDVKTAGQQDSEQVVATLTAAFVVDPMNRFAFPDPQNYLVHFPHFVRAFAGRAFELGSAHRTEDYEGAALWLPPGVGPDEAALEEIMEIAVPESRQADLVSVLEQMGHYHPEEPHWYLPLIGVDPAHQNKGVGSALLRRGVEQADRDGTLAYLEATTRQSLQLYERYGFEIVGEIQAGASPILWPMVRGPRDAYGG